MTSLRHLTFGLLLAGSLSLYAGGFASPTQTNYVDLVNPLIGSQSTFDLSAGNTYPVISMGDEQLDTPDGKDGRWLAIQLSSEQNSRDQADASAQSMDQ